MQVTIPDGCGNAPRQQIVADFVTAWASGDVSGVAEWLSDTVSWNFVGDRELVGGEVASESMLDWEPERLNITSLITHGRLASCDGVAEGNGHRLAFSHVFRFASTGKAAKIAELRSYCVT